MKKLICAILILATLMLSGCGFVSYDSIKEYIDFLSGDVEFISKEDSKALEKASATPRITFSYEDDDEFEVVFTTSELRDYVPRFLSYRSSYCYDMLTENEKLFYRAFEYSMENGYDTIRFSDHFFSDDSDIETALFFLAMDSPLVEQNLHYSLYAFTSSYPLSEEKPHIQVPFNGYRITVDNFSEELLKKRLEALTKAREIVSGMPEGLSEIDRCEYLYRYLVSNTVYETYEDPDKVYPYLYDALILNKTHCDGYSNALSLLFNSAGISCIEKYSKSPTDGEPGHTWVLAQIDGGWYNFDGATNSSSLPLSKGLGGGCYFAFADELLDYVPRYGDKLPRAEKGYYLNKTAHFEAEDSEGVLDCFIGGIKSSNNKYCIVSFDSFSYENCQPILQKAVDELQISVRTVTFIGKTRTILYVEVTE